MSPPGGVFRIGGGTLACEMPMRSSAIKHASANRERFTLRVLYRAHIYRRRRRGEPQPNHLNSTKVMSSTRNGALDCSRPAAALFWILLGGGLALTAQFLQGLTNT